MIDPEQRPPTASASCRACREGEGSPIAISMAFQPLVDLRARAIVGYEALVRGPSQESAAHVLAQVNDTNRYAFDQSCRVRAIELAAQLGLQGMLSINFLPNAVYRPETCIRATLQAARTHGFPTERLIFEVNESERVVDHAHLKAIFAEYHRQGFTTAIDDFGAGHSGLNLLAEFQPDIVKLDMALTRHIDRDRVRRSIVQATMGMCADLGIRVIAEGIETAEECLALQDLGVHLFQGYLFARPGFEHLPAVGPEAWGAVTRTTGV